MYRTGCEAADIYKDSMSAMVNSSKVLVCGVPLSLLTSIQLPGPSSNLRPKQMCCTCRLCFVRFVENDSQLDEHKTSKLIAIVHGRPCMD